MNGMNTPIRDSTSASVGEVSGICSTDNGNGDLGGDNQNLRER